MRTREAVLTYQEQQSSDNSSKTFDLDIVDPVSALSFEFECVNGTTNNQNNPLSRCINSIEIVDASDVLAKLSFEQLQALTWYKTRKQPQLREDEQGSQGDVIGADLLFGRYLYDREYAMDFTRFKNPQLKISWNLGTTRAVSATTAIATGTLKISAIAKIMEDMGGAPSKFLMQKEINSWTGGTSGEKRVELPADYVYRMLMLRTYLQGNDVDENISQIKLTCDTDKFIMMNRYTKQFDAEMARLFGNIVMWKRCHAAHGDTVWVPIDKEPQVDLTVPTLHYVASYAWCWSGNFYLYLSDGSAGSVSSDTRVDAKIEGHALHSTVPIPFGLPMEPDTWFDPTVYKKVEAVLTEAAAAANSVVLEQVRPL